MYSYIRFLMMSFRMRTLLSFFNGVLVYGNFNSSRDDDDGFTFPPLFWSTVTSGSCLWCLLSRACSWNLSWQYVNPMSWSVMDGEGGFG